MPNLISYYKVVKNEDGSFEIKAVVLAGISQDGIVLDAGKLNNEISDSIQYFYNKRIENKLSDLVVKQGENNRNGDINEDLNVEIENLREQLTELKTISSPALSDYTFINRLAVSILNEKTFRITGEINLYKALKINGNNDNVEMLELSETRKNVINIMAEMLEVKNCPYIKPLNIKLNLKETSQLIAIANSAKARWTTKGIKIKTSKTIETEVAIQSILFVCKNCFKMVVPVKTSTDDRSYI